MISIYFVHVYKISFEIKQVFLKRHSPNVVAVLIDIVSLSDSDGIVIISSGCKGSFSSGISISSGFESSVISISSGFECPEGEP